MCGGSHTIRQRGFGSEQHHHGPFGSEVENMSPGTRILAALTVLVPVALSGLFLVVFVPDLWWIFTTYFWISFPAVRLLASGVACLSEGRPARVPEEARERELLTALRKHGEVSAAAAAAETSLSVEEADRKLGELAGEGHLEVRVRGRGLFYALWEDREVAETLGPEGLRAEQRRVGSLET